MVPHSPCDRLCTEMSFPEQWIMGAASTLVEVCLFLASELLSAGMLYLGRSMAGLAETVRNRSYQPRGQRSKDMAGVSSGKTDFHFNRNHPEHLSQSRAGVHPHSLPDLILSGDGWSLGEGEDQMDTQSDHQSEMASTYTHPFILSLISPAMVETGRSLDQTNEQAPSDWLSDPEEDDAASSDWSSDEDDEQENEESEANELWDSFFVHDPYNPMNFSASMGHQSQNEEEEGSSSQFETEKESENDKLCDSFFQSTDPFNPLNGSASRDGHVPNEKGVKDGVWNTELSEEESADCSGPRHNTGLCEGEDCSTPTVKQTCEMEGKTVRKVRFSPVVKLHPMIVWDFAYRAARKGPWEQHARDRSRFQRRIAETEAAIASCLEQRHRLAVWTKLYSD